MAEKLKFVQYTTPTFEIRITSCIDMSQFEEMHITFSQGSTEVDIDSPEVLPDNVLRAELTQEQTGKFSPRQPVKIMINLLPGDGRRFSNKEPIWAEVVENSLKRVIT